MTAKAGITHPQEKRKAISPSSELPGFLALFFIEKRDDKLAGEIGWFEAIRRPSYDKESDRIAVKIEYMGAGKMPDDWQKMPRVPAAIKKNDMMTTDC